MDFGLYLGQRLWFSAPKPPAIAAPWGIERASWAWGALVSAASSSCAEAGLRGKPPAATASYVRFLDGRAFERQNRARLRNLILMKRTTRACDATNATDARVFVCGGSAVGPSLFSLPYFLFPSAIVQRRVPCPYT